MLDWVEDGELRIEDGLSECAILELLSSILD